MHSAVGFPTICQLLDDTKTKDGLEMLANSRKSNKQNIARLLRHDFEIPSLPTNKSTLFLSSLSLEREPARTSVCDGI